MMLDVWQNVFVMRMSASQRWLIWVGLRIVPVALVAGAPDLIAIVLDQE